MINAKEHFGAVGDGIANDTDALIAALSHPTDNRVHIPAGTYRIDKPLPWGYFKHITGDGPVNRGQALYNGTTIIAMETMQTMFEAPSWKTDSYFHFAQIKDLFLNCNGLAENGVRLHRSGEATELNRVHIHSAAGSGLWLTGDSATFTGRNIVINQCGNGAVAFTRHPQHGVSNGTYRFFGLSGDQNRGGFIRTNTGIMLEISGLKVEYPDADGARTNAIITATSEMLNGVECAGWNGDGQFYLQLTGGSINYGQSRLLNQIILLEEEVFADINVGCVRSTGTKAIEWWVKDNTGRKIGDLPFRQVGPFHWGSWRKAGG